MYKRIKMNGRLKRFDNYKLCFIQPISQTIMVDSPESVAFQKTIEYKELRATDPHWYFHPLLRMIDAPNPEFDRNKNTHLAYFTPLSLDEQWGDDWNDGMTGSYGDIPYDTDNNNQPIEILTMAFCLNLHPFDDEEEFYTQWKMPDDIAPYRTIQDVNRGVLPWLYAESNDCKDYVIIHAGVSPYEFVRRLKDFKRRNNIEW